VTSSVPLAAVDAALRDHFGQAPVRASVSFVGVEPIEVLRFEPIPGEWAYVTLGMSRRSMTAADEFVQASDGPRAELMLSVRDPQRVFEDVWRRLAVLAAAPVVEGVVYVPGMTVDLGEPLAQGSLCTGIVTAESAVEPIDGVDVLAVLPATQNELAWARVNGGAKLVDRWRAEGTDLLDLTRGTVRFA